MTTETGGAEALPVIEILPSRGWRSVDLRELWAYRELLQIFLWRDVKVRYRQTLLGVVWVVAQPLLTTGIFTLLFHRVASISTGSVPYPLFVMAGMMPWMLFSSGVSASSNSLIGSTHLISKVYFPRLIVPAAAILSGLVDHAVTLVAFSFLLAMYGVGVGPSVLILPVAVMLCLAMTLGVGLWLSALNVEYRDIRIVVPFVTQVWMWVTPVAYPETAIPLSFRWLVRLNPVTGVVNLFRSALLGTPMELPSVAYSFVCAIVVLITGALYFRRTERTFADVL